LETSISNNDIVLGKIMEYQQTQKLGQRKKPLNNKNNME
jgi:hypothetical protein